MTLPSPTSDGPAESCLQRPCRALVVTALLRQWLSWRDIVAEATWPWRKVAAESCCMTGVRIYDRSGDVRLALGCTCIIGLYNGL
jgi:hypothetical protein